MFDLAHWVQAYGSFVGYAVVSAIIFAETGLFFGFFLPGDSILFPAGILASKGYFNLWLLCLLVFTAAVLGNVVGYYFGKYVGKRLFTRDDSFLFRKKHLKHAHEFYEKHGGKTILLARFIPVIRTFGPIVAGISDMHFGRFIAYSATGAIIWAVGIPIAGYYLGKSVPNIDKYLLPIILFIISLSLIPAFYESLKTEERRAQLLRFLTKKKKS